MDEIFVDNFAGGGGASEGISWAIGRDVDIAVNHDPAAIAMHCANHPGTKHYCEDIWHVDPVEACAGRPVALAWFSPDCRHFSRAKGGKPVEKNIRGLAWVVLRWAYLVHPRVIMLENVPEIQTWGPLDESNRPIKEREGETWRAFLGALGHGMDRECLPAVGEMCEALEIDPNGTMAWQLMSGLGYDVEWRELLSCDYGAPTKRRRLYLIARFDGKPIRWPAQTHAKRGSREQVEGHLPCWRSAAEVIDWSKPCPSIFERKKPLAENTLRRIARGLQKFVIENPEPFIVQVKYDNTEQDVNDPLSTVTAVNSHMLCMPTLIQYHTEHHEGETRGQALTEPLQTADTSNRYGLAAATLVQTGYGERDGQAPRALDPREPLGTVVAGGSKHAAVTAFLQKYYGGGYQGAGSAVDEPLDTITAIDHNSLCTASIVQLNHNTDGQAMDEPLATITAGGGHFAEVRALPIKYYGAGTGQAIDEPLDTVTARDRFGLVEIHGTKYQIADIGLRMLEPRELFNAQGCPADYIIDRDAEGHPLSKKEQVAKCGNMVTPPVPAALVRANLPEYCQ